MRLVVGPSIQLCYNPQSANLALVKSSTHSMPDLGADTISQDIRNILNVALPQILARMVAPDKFPCEAVRTITYHATLMAHRWHMAIS